MRFRARYRVAAIAAIGLTTALAAGPSALAAPGQAGRGGPAVAANQADHWGSFFGSDNDEQLSPVPISLPGQVVQVGTSNSAQYALLSNGQVWAWGQGGNGQLGDGGTADSFSQPVQVQFPAGVRIAFLATDVMPYNTGLAVDTTGHAWGWGYNRHGQLCLNNKKTYLKPVQLPFANVTTLAGARGHAFYDSAGVVYACGDNYAGVLGDGNFGNGRRSPVRVTGLGHGSVVTLFASWENGGALLANGEYLDWGYDNAGQLGDGRFDDNADVPTQVQLPGAVTQVALGGSTPTNGQTIVKLANGALYAWGSDRFSQLGDGRSTDEPGPVPIFAPDHVLYASLASAGATSYAIATTGVVYAWGYNGNGEVGNGQTKTVRRPVAVDANAGLISGTAGDVTVATGSPTTTH